MKKGGAVVTVEVKQGKMLWSDRQEREEHLLTGTKAAQANLLECNVTLSELRGGCCPGGSMSDTGNYNCTTPSS